MPSIYYVAIGRVCQVPKMPFWGFYALETAPAKTPFLLKSWLSAYKESGKTAVDSGRVGVVE